jgi:hypothetical protein
MRHFWPLAWVGLAHLLAAQGAAAQSLTVAPVEPAKDAGAVESKTLIPPLRTGNDDAYLELYGQINKGLLIFDDGAGTLAYFPVDNGNSSSRVGVRGFLALEDDWSIGANLEAEWTPYSTNSVNQLNHGEFNWDAFLLRKAEIYVKGQIGTIWIGQGSMASDGTAESDLSGTSVIGHSVVSDMAGGSLFTLSDSTLSARSVKSVFNNFDGLSRKLRVRYDTPSFNGFSASASLGQQVVPTVTDVTVWDIAARYAGTIEDVKIAGALAFSRPGDDRSIVDGSISLLHVPTGLSVTLASGTETSGGAYGYAKLGYQTDFFDFGMTAISVDGYAGSDIGGAGRHSKSLGLQLVQNVDYLQTEFYVGGRIFEYDEASADFNDASALLVGARAKF